MHRRVWVWTLGLSLVAGSLAEAEVIKGVMAVNNTHMS
jgi:hypothetical protein